MNYFDTNSRSNDERVRSGRSYEQDIAVSDSALESVFLRLVEAVPFAQLLYDAGRRRLPPWREGLSEVERRFLGLQGRPHWGRPLSDSHFSAAALEHQ